MAAFCCRMLLRLTSLDTRAGVLCDLRVIWWIEWRGGLSAPRTLVYDLLKILTQYVAFWQLYVSGLFAQLFAPWPL